MPETLRPEERKRGGRRCGRRTPLLALLALTGCATAGPRLPVRERGDLARRSQDLLLRAAQNDDPVVACNAIEALVQVAPSEGLPAFRSALQSAAPLVRFGGCVALGELRDRTAAEALRHLRSDPERRVQIGAAFALYRCGDTSQGRVLADTLADHPEENLRADAAFLIGRLGEKRAAKRLRSALADEKSNKVIVQIHYALALLGQKDSVDQLVAYTAGDAASRVLAMQALLDLKDVRAREALLFRLNDKAEYLETRLLAARALGKLGVNAGQRLALESLSYTGNNPEDPDATMRVRTMAALALGAIRDESAAGALQRLAETSTDPRVQVAAALALCQMLGSGSR